MPSVPATVKAQRRGYPALMIPAATLLGGRYQLDEPIGAGGYCEVWRATDTVLARPVAVKLLHPGYAHQAEALARFQAEARHAGSFSHPNIARVYDYGEAAGGQPPYLVMELVEGPSLAVVLGRGPLDAVRAMDAIAQSAVGLQAAHSAGLIHRDIKPANILFAPDGMVKITDFGIAHAVGAAPVTTTGMVMGTPGYIAPERVSGAQAQPPSDLYALGIVAYECLTGAQPFTGSALEVALAHRDHPLPPLPAWVPAGVVELVMSLTAKDPAWRPGSAAEVAAWASRLRDDLRGGSPDGPGADPDAAWFVPVAVPDVPPPGQPEPPQGPRPEPPPGLLVEPPRGLLVEPPRGLLVEPPDSTIADAWPPTPGVPRRTRTRARAARFRRKRIPALAAILLAALAGLGLASVTGFSLVPHGSGSPSYAPSSAPADPATPRPPSPVSSPAGPSGETSPPGSSGTDSRATPAATVSGASAAPSGPSHKKGHGHGHGNGSGNDQGG
jgi:eukaryotic-like serine/threonine-protein kinase